MSATPGSLGLWARAALSFIYPEICQVCKVERSGPEHGFVCDGCRSKVKHIEQPFCERCGLPYEGAITTAFKCSNCAELKLQFSYARSAVLSESIVREVVHFYKYHRALWHEPFLAGLLVAAAAPDLARNRWDMIVPVPLHPTKLREREFNQAERLGRQLAVTTGIPLVTNLLGRVLPTRTQTQLSRRERLENVRKAFVFSGKRKLNGQKVVVVDDVLTTGATTSACAHMLLKAGADEVCVWTVARGT